MSNNLKHHSGGSEEPQLMRADPDELGRKGQASGNGTCRDQAASAKISALLNDTGLSVLTANSTLDDRDVCDFKSSHGITRMYTDKLNPCFPCKSVAALPSHATLKLSFRSLPAICFRKN